MSHSNLKAYTDFLIDETEKGRMFVEWSGYGGPLYY